MEEELILTVRAEAKTFSVEGQENDADLLRDVNNIVDMYRDLSSLSVSVPPPLGPKSFTVSHAQQVKKLFDAGRSAMTAKKYVDAEKLFSLALNMAMKRHKWEPFVLSMQEISLLVSSRCDANIGAGKWLDAFMDVDLLVTVMQTSPENMYRRAVCLQKLDRLEEAKATLERGLCFAPEHPKLTEALKEVSKAIDELIDP